MNYYKHHIGDFDRATRHLTRVERSVYRDLIEVYYDTEKPLTLDIRSLCRRIIARTDEESTAVEQVLNEFFTETPLGWYHDRCEKEIDDFKESASQKSAAGKASAAKRELKRQQALNGNSTSVEQTFNETPTNHKPLTTNHEPVTSNQDKPKPAKPSAGLSASDLVNLGVDEQVAKDFLEVRKAKRAPLTTTSAKKKKPLSSLPENFDVSDAVRQWAKTNGFSDKRVADNFANFVLTAQAKGYTYADWDRALMKAIRDNWTKTTDVHPVQQQTGYKEYRPK